MLNQNSLSYAAKLRLAGGTLLVYGLVEAAIFLPLFWLVAMGCILLAYSITSWLLSLGWSNMFSIHHMLSATGWRSDSLIQ